MQNIAVSGANGFIGQALVRRLAEKPGVSVLALVRSQVRSGEAKARYTTVGDLTQDTGLESIVKGIDVVVHTAARVHVMRETEHDSLGQFRRVNVAGTLNLASQAASIGVKRFVFISSVGVHGIGSLPGRPFEPTDVAAPHDAYTQSKWEAEQALRALEIDSGMEVVVVRPPLVYGPNAPGNFGALKRSVQRGIPLPLGAVDNRRSLVALDNLVDLLVRCVEHPAAAGQTFLVSDGEDLSTPELIRRLAKAMGRQARLFPAPLVTLRLAGRLTGKSALVERLLGSLQVDIRHPRETLGWIPPIAVIEGLRRAVVSV